MLVSLVGTTGVGQGLRRCPLGISGGSQVLGEAISPLEMTPTHTGTHPSLQHTLSLPIITVIYIELENMEQMKSTNGL